VEHVLGLDVGRVGGSVAVNVGADVGEEMLAITRQGDGGPETLEFMLVILQDFAVAGQVVLFQGRGCEGGFGVEEPRQLRYQSVTLEICCLVIRFGAW
jgi:hypothetical protein